MIRCWKIFVSELDADSLLELAAHGAMGQSSSQLFPRILGHDTLPREEKEQWMGQSLKVRSMYGTMQLAYRAHNGLGGRWTDHRNIGIWQMAYPPGDD